MTLIEAIEQCQKNNRRILALLEKIESNPKLQTDEIIAALNDLVKQDRTTEKLLEAEVAKAGKRKSR